MEGSGTGMGSGTTIGAGVPIARNSNAGHTRLVLRCCRAADEATSTTFVGARCAVGRGYILVHVAVLSGLVGITVAGRFLTRDGIGGCGAFKAMGQPLVIPALAFMVIVFWLLDARYLQHEICFRAVHDEVREEPPDQRPDFRLSPPRNKASLCRGLFSWSTAFLYPSLLVFLLLFRSLLP